MHSFFEEFIPRWITCCKIRKHLHIIECSPLGPKPLRLRCLQVSYSYEVLSYDLGRLGRTLISAHDKSGLLLSLSSLSISIYAIIGVSHEGASRCTGDRIGASWRGFPILEAIRYLEVGNVLAELVHGHHAVRRCVLRSSTRTGHFGGCGDASRACPDFVGRLKGWHFLRLVGFDVDASAMRRVKQSGMSYVKYVLVKEYFDCYVLSEMR